MHWAVNKNFTFFCENQIFLIIEIVVSILSLKIFSAYFFKKKNDVKVPKAFLYGSGLSTDGNECKL